MGILAASARRHIWNYSIDDCAQIVASLAKSKVVNPGFIGRVVDRVSPESVKEASFESLVNMMTGFARFGIRSSPKKDIWGILADELSDRVASSDLKSDCVTDMLNALTAFSYPNVNKPHDALFGIISTRLRDGRLLNPAEVTKYLLACSRVQFRDPEMLSFCGKCLRSSGAIPSMSTEDLLALYTSLDKLGADMPEIAEVLSSRGVRVSASPKPTTWFRAHSGSSSLGKHS